jgi:hypothetical protein
VNVHGFSEQPGLMTILLDQEGFSPPVFMNIIEAFKVLSEESQPGDAVFVLFSGHGGRVMDEPLDEDEQETYDEMIVPSDYHVSGVIRDTLIFKTLLAPMRYGVTVTIMVDACDNGMILDLPYSWTARSERKDAIAKVRMTQNMTYYSR